ncbi:unnamed protein product [Peniophora sp. CBMAI 1063]|nr:unnamed protein product [Peniophora sp. CBMAI 1063]
MTILHSHLPPNVRFETVDITHPLSVEPESFDLIHARLLFVHVRDPAAVIGRVASLLKPGGWVVIEEPDDLDFDEDGRPRGLAKHVPAIAHQYDVFRQRGLDLAFWRRLENVLQDTGVLEMVTAVKLDMPFTSRDHNEKLLALGKTYRDGLLTLVHAGVTAGRTRFT